MLILMIQLFWKLYPKRVTKLINKTVNKEGNWLERRPERQGLSDKKSPLAAES